MSASIIDKKGNIIYTAPKIGFTHFTEGLCRVLIDNPNGGYKFGYIDQTGKLVIPYQYEDADFFKGGVARVKKNGLWGLINSTGKLICPFYHNEDYVESVPTIHDGIICKWENDPKDKNKAKLSYIDINGNVVIDTSDYSYIDDFCNGYARVKKSDNTCALIDTKGKVVIPFGAYDFIGEVHCGVAQVEKYINHNIHYGYVNVLGEEVIPIGKYDEFYWNKQDLDLAVVCAIKNGKYGCVDIRTGCELVPCEYDPHPKYSPAINRYTNKLITHENTTIVIKLKNHFNTTSNTIYFYNTKTYKLIKSDVLDDAGQFNENLCAVKKNGKIGFINDSCQLVIPYKFDDSSDRVSICKFEGGICEISNMFIDKQGNIIKKFDKSYHHFMYIGDGTYCCNKYRNYSKNISLPGVALVNLKGDTIFEGYSAETYPIKSEFPIAVIDENISYNNNTWRFIDKNGKTAFPYVLNKGYRFVNGFAVINETIAAKKRHQEKDNKRTTEDITNQVEEYIFCPKCGRKILADKIICPHCYVKVRNYKVKPYDNNKRKHRSCGCVVFIILLLLSGGYIMGSII